MSEVQTIDSEGDLVDFLLPKHPVDMAYRGEDRYYRHMKARIDRCLNLKSHKARLRMERAICQRFREQAPIYLSTVEHQYLRTRWLSLTPMQHYGAPTRLLDWTKSGWVATFFAVSNAWKDDGYIYAFRRDKLEKAVQTSITTDIKDLVWGPHLNDTTYSTEVLTSENNEPLFFHESSSKLSDWIATYYVREPHFPRLVAQQGLFTFCSKPDMDHWRQILRVLEKDMYFIARIKADRKPHLLRFLNNVGLNGATLFPGSDGIGKSLEGFARAWPLGPEPSQYQNRDLLQ